VRHLVREQALAAVAALVELLPQAQQVMVKRPTILRQLAVVLAAIVLQVQQ
jgi:hypothetical protein